MGIATLVIFGLVVLLGAFTHRLTGMGFSLVSSAPLAMVLGPHDSVAVLQIFGVVLAVVVLAQTWRDVDWQILGWLMIPALLGIIPGALIARRMTVPMLELTVGLLVLVALSIAALAPRARVFKGRPGAVAVGVISGVMNAMASLAGAPLALYRISSGWAQRSFVATIQVYFVVICSATLVGRGIPQLPPSAWAISVVGISAGIGLGAVSAARIPDSLALKLTYLVAVGGAVATLIKGLSAMTA